MKDYKLEFSLPLEALEEKKVSSTSIFDGKVLHVRLDEITLPNGKGATREYCHHNGAVCVIPICDNGDVLCVRQFRYPFGEPLIEIPAGKLDSPDENPDDAVRRELCMPCFIWNSKRPSSTIRWSSSAYLSWCFWPSPLSRKIPVRSSTKR